jgi:hypothetical protein
MFSVWHRPMREAKEAEVPLPDLSHDVFRAFLEFLYTDEVCGLCEWMLSGVWLLRKGRLYVSPHR